MFNNKEVKRLTKIVNNLLKTLRLRVVNEKVVKDSFLLPTCSAEELDNIRMEIIAIDKKLNLLLDYLKLEYEEKPKEHYPRIIKRKKGGK